MHLLSNSKILKLLSLELTDPFLLYFTDLGFSKADQADSPSKRDTKNPSRWPKETKRQTKLLSTHRTSLINGKNLNPFQQLYRRNKKNKRPRKTIILP
jgi:hypothetical protein